MEKPSGGAGSYTLQHTGRESHQAFQDVNLGPAAQSGPVTLSPSPTDLAIAPKTEDRDDADFGDHLQVSLFFFFFLSVKLPPFDCVHPPESLTCVSNFCFM